MELRHKKELHSLWKSIIWFFKALYLSFKKIFPILLLFLAPIALYFSISHRDTILTFLGLSATPNTIELRIYYQWIGGIIVGAALVWNAISLSRRVKAQTKQLQIEGQRAENEAYSNKNQQFLDAVRLFEDATTLETKKGALFHLENLALSSPAHRQRVLDFLNSLNSWMRDVDVSNFLKKQEETKLQEQLKGKTAKEKKEYISLETKKLTFRTNRSFETLIGNRVIKKWQKWKNEKKVLLDDLDIVTKDKQLLSIEIPKIFENIIKHHNKTWQKDDLELDFSYFIFAQISFREEVFPQKKTDFSDSHFLGETDFFNAHFKGKTNFSYAHFEGITSFFKTHFEGKTSFICSHFKGETQIFSARFTKEVGFRQAKFEGITEINNTRFFGTVSLKKTYFHGVTYFLGTRFIQKVDFSCATFIGKTDFFSVLFLNKTNFLHVSFEKSLLISFSKDVFFSLKDNNTFHKFYYNLDKIWHTIILNTEQEKFFYNLDDRGKPKNNWTEEERRRWEIYNLPENVAERKETRERHKNP